MTCRLLIFVPVMALLAGCGGGPKRPSVAKVTGKVSHQGAPLADAVVMFYPQEAGGGRPATGRTDASGMFSLTTFETGDGAVVGRHKVTINAGAAESESNDPAALAAAEKARAKLPEKLSTVEKTTLSVEVAADATQNNFEWDLDKL